MNSRNEAELEKAKESLIKQKDIVLAYLADETKNQMANEEADLAVVKENIFRCNTFILSLSPAFGGSSVQRDEFSVVGVRLQCSSHSCGFIGSLFPVAYGRNTVFFHKDVGIVALCNDNVVIKRLSV